MSRARPARAARLRTLSLWLSAVVLAGIPAGCDDDIAVDPLIDLGPGAVDEAWFTERKLDYLRFATATVEPEDIVNTLAHLTRDRIDTTYTAPDGAVPAEAWDHALAKMSALEDTRDFDALYLLHVVLDYRDHPMLDPGLVDRVERALLDFKYWYTDPTPAGLIDGSIYWTENHEIIFLTIEYLMGRAYPDQIFTITGLTGAEHAERARPRILRWIELRARFGFSEWHSNVYYQRDIAPLVTLIEHADDPDIVTGSAAILDLVVFDLALHNLRGAFGVTHGRSYKKNKMTSLTEDTWNASKLLFDNNDLPYQAPLPYEALPLPGSKEAVLLAGSTVYEYPEAIRRIANYSGVFVDRERMGIAIDEDGPLQADPPTPDGLSLSDLEDLTAWWATGSFLAWPVLPLTIEALDTYGLWEHPSFAIALPFREFTEDPAFAQLLSIGLAKVVNGGLLNEVNTYTWRAPEVMLSSALDYRKGRAAAQAHSWQATFDANAIVFTNHPFQPLAMSTDWLDDPESGGYWNGEGSMPRSAQIENVAVHIYAPQYDQVNDPPLEAFGYQSFTHAYVPQDHFDEVIRAGHWTFARKGDGYLALYSFRLAEFLAYDPEVYATNGMIEPFDLVADGGADNVWIVECGRAADWGSFEAFRAAIEVSEVTVTSLGPGEPSGISDGFDVVYHSPSQGLLSFGWDAPFAVEGIEIAQGEFRRYDNPWTQTEFDSDTMTIEIDGYGLALDFAAGARLVYGPAADDGEE